MSTYEPNLLTIRFQGAPMATLAFRPDRQEHALLFERQFVDLRHDLSPAHLPLAQFGLGVHIFRPGDSPFVGGLPGLIADSLPDAWGERMLRKEVEGGLRTVLGKLAAIGLRGPGALTFEPTLGAGRDEIVTTEHLSDLAKEADALRSSPVPLGSGPVAEALARGGSSLGGAFPKTSAHLPMDCAILERSEILIGGQTPQGYSPCILKFARTDEAEGAVEFAFWQMAKAAGIRVPNACLVVDGKQRHFASARFDRVPLPAGGWGRRHVHTLAGMLHKRAADGAIDYGEFLRLTQRLCGPAEAHECFRRAVFNLLATNRDDHGRNHAFLYDEGSRSWTLTPAYDLNPNVVNVLIGLSWLDSMEIPKRFDELLRLAEVVSIDGGQARAIYEEVEAAVGGWPNYAAMAGVPAEIATYWQHEILTQTAALRASARHAQPHATVPPPPRGGRKP
jgi:serine/threonine-protein kinase HipA